MDVLEKSSQKLNNIAPRENLIVLNLFNKSKLLQLKDFNKKDFDKKSKSSMIAASDYP